MSDGLRTQVASLVRAFGGQRAFATEIGVHQSAVSRYLTGQHELSAPFARALLKRFPGLEEEITAVFFDRDMRKDHESHATLVG